MTRRKLEDLNLIDNFLFEALVSHPEFGEPFCRIMLSILMQREVGQVKVVSQKTYPGSDTDRHGSRLDVYVEEYFNGDMNMDIGGLPVLYDIEPEKGEKNKSSLPRRVRFYHSSIDHGSLASGTEYLKLRHVYVIMITTFDPFGYDHILYTVRNTCIEVPELPYDDGAATFFFYTKGKEGKCADEIRELLHFMENTQDANAVSSRIRQILDMVSMVKHDERMKVAYVKSFERDELIREEVREEMQAEVDRAKAEATEAKSEAVEARAETAEARAETMKVRAAADAAMQALHEKDKRIEALEKQLAELRAAMN